LFCFVGDLNNEGRICGNPPLMTGGDRNESPPQILPSQPFLLLVSMIWFSAETHYSPRISFLVLALVVCPLLRKRHGEEKIAPRGELVQPLLSLAR